MKVAIVGSRRYENKKKIKDFVFKLKNQYGEKTIIVSGGCKTGADKYAKKYALELGCNYLECNPAHTPKNLYSYMREDWYGKKYSIRNFHVRNKILVGLIDRIIAFVPEGVSSNGTISTINYANKFSKKCIVIT